MTMASSTDRDNDNKPKTTANNPFIRFRQFADEQVGSFLQGIIGLPSAFAKNPGGTARWADFDDELKRRDELQARQRELRESESRRGQDKAEKPAPPSDGSASGRVYYPRNISAGREIPLYAPVSKELFANLLPAGFDPEWKSYNEMPSEERYAFRSDYIPFKLRKDQEPGSDMEALQFMAYNELNGSDTFRSDYSVLPYLLFSPYSPIRLHIEGSQQHRNQNSMIDNFPYHAAFEDLLRTTQSHIGSPWPRNIRAYPPFSRMSISGGGHSVLVWMAWVHDLYGENLLQQREFRDLPRLPDMIPSDAFALEKQKLSQPTTPKGEEDANTEQDMYDRFLQWASAPTAIVTALDSLCAETEGFIEKQIKALHSPENKNKIKDLETSFGKDIQTIFQMLQGSSEHEQRSIFQEKTVQVNSNSSKTQDPEKLVSTSTTISHTTNEDGSVETEVTVWKRFADGRETTTTTTHLEDASSNGAISDEATNKSQDLRNAEKVEGAKKEEKKGWFWN